MSVKVGVISDTHGLLRPEVLEVLRGCDVILHGGDINKPEILDILHEIAPLYVVRGNNDKEWAENLPKNITFSIENVNFFMVHNKKEIPKELKADIVVFGHSHKYYEQMQGECLWLNPGSCGKRRFDQEITLAVLSIDAADYQVQKIVLSHQKGASTCN